MTDVRVARTRSLVIAAVRQLLAHDGAAAVTYSSVARRSGSTRQTLYRHWPTITALMADAVLAGPPAHYPEPSGDLRANLVGFLTSLSVGLRDPATTASLSSLLAVAQHDSTAAATLATITADRLAALNALSGDAEMHAAFTALEFSRLVGPVMFRRLFELVELTDSEISEIVDAFIATRGPSA